MAIIQYTAIVNEIRGSIGGSTFQRNGIGTIIRRKPIPTGKFSNRQSDKRKNIIKIKNAWNNLSIAQKLDWDNFASINEKRNYIDRSYLITGFNWFASININRIEERETILNTPPTYHLPPAVINYSINANTDEIKIIFDELPIFDDYYYIILVKIGGYGLSNRILGRYLKIASIKALTSPEVNLTVKIQYHFGLTFPLNEIFVGKSVAIRVIPISKISYINNFGLWKIATIT